MKLIQEVEWQIYWNAGTLFGPKQFKVEQGY